MQVILLEKVRGVGGIGEEVSVAPGFARNYLLPRKKALRATSANKEFFQAQREVLEKENDLLRQSAEAQLALIPEGSVITIHRQAAEDGKLYGSVSIRDITKAFFDMTGIEVSSEQILLDAKLKYLGMFSAQVILHPDVVLTVGLHITRNEQDLIK